jgi:hypothetical protein
MDRTAMFWRFCGAVVIVGCAGCQPPGVPRAPKDERPPRAEPYAVPLSDVRVWIDPPFVGWMAQSDVILLDARTATLTHFVEPHVGAFSFSTDLRHLLVFIEPHDVALYDFDGETPRRRLTFSNLYPCLETCGDFENGYCAFAEWSPDGEWLLLDDQLVALGSAKVHAVPEPTSVAVGERDTRRVSNGGVVLSPISNDFGDDTLIVTRVGQTVARLPLAEPDDAFWQWGGGDRILAVNGPQGADVYSTRDWTLRWSRTGFFVSAASTTYDLLVLSREGQRWTKLLVDAATGREVERWDGPPCDECDTGNAISVGETIAIPMPAADSRTTDVLLWKERWTRRLSGQSLAPDFSPSGRLFVNEHGLWDAARWLPVSPEITHDVTFAPDESHAAGVTRDENLVIADVLARETKADFQGSPDGHAWLLPHLLAAFDKKRCHEVDLTLVGDSVRYASVRAGLVEGEPAVATRYATFSPGVTPTVREMLLRGR